MFFLNSSVAWIDSVGFLIKQPHNAVLDWSFVSFVNPAEAKKNNDQYMFTSEIRTHGFFFVVFSFFSVGWWKKHSCMNCVNTSSLKQYV